MTRRRVQPKIRFGTNSTSCGEVAAQALKQHLLVSRDRALVRVDVIARGFNCEELSYLARMGTD